MNSNKLLIVIASIFVLSCTQKEKRCIITGTVINRPQSEFIILAKASDDLRSPDVVRIPIQDGKFTYEFSYSEIEAYNLVFEDEHNKGRWRNNYFFPTNGQVEVLLNDMENATNNNVKGGKENQNYNEFQKDIISKYSLLYDNYNMKIDSLVNIGEYESDTIKTIRKLIADYPARSDEQQELFRQLTTLRRENLHLTDEAKVITNELNEQIKKLNTEKLNYIDRNPSIATYFFLIESLKKSSESFDATHLKRIANKFSLKYKTHPYTKQLLQKPLAIGEQYFDVTLNDLNGTPYKLSDIISGQFAIIDIWAPWCGYCIAKSRALKSLYNEFNHDDFEIVGISSKYYKLEDVEKVLSRENYPWITLIDSPDWKSEINIQYNIVNAGGVILMVDKEGVVLAINPTIDFIRNTLQERIY